MIAVVEREVFLCVVRWVGRKGLKAKAQTYCGDTVDVGDGVLQVPDQPEKWGLLPCPNCKRVLGW